MGRVDNATQHHQGLEFQEIHQSPAGGDAPPPPPDEDLYEPPVSYQPPLPSTKPPPQAHPFPPTQDNGYDKPPQPFPPQQDAAAAKPFPPHQEHTPQPFPPDQYSPQPSPLIMPQQNLLLPHPWKNHLFDCMRNPQNAIITLFFPCVTFGQIAEVLDNGNSSCATSGILYSCIAFCIGMPCLMSCGYRSKLRAKFGLAESGGPDCLIHCFCEYCALCQEYRELEDRGFDPSIGHAGNVAKQQKQRLQQFGLTPPMQQTMI